MYLISWHYLNINNTAWEKNSDTICNALRMKNNLQKSLAENESESWGVKFTMKKLGLVAYFVICVTDT